MVRCKLNPKLIQHFCTPVVFHEHATLTFQKQTSPHADMPTLPPAFVSPSHTLIEPRPHEGEEVLPVLVPPLNAFTDPWSPELAHAFPWNVRQVALAEFLDGLEPSLDFPNTNA